MNANNQRSRMRSPRLIILRRYVAACCLALLFIASVYSPSARAAERLGLSGGGWELRTGQENDWRPVTVPHCWPLDAGSLKYLGEAFYRTEFSAPLGLKDKVVRLRFEAVFYKCSVRLNGMPLGTYHMGNNNRWAREGGVIDELLVENMYRNPESNPLVLDSIMLEKVVEEPNITPIDDFAQEGNETVVLAVISGTTSYIAARMQSANRKSILI